MSAERFSPESRQEAIERAIEKVVDAALTSQAVWVLAQHYIEVSYIFAGINAICTVRRLPGDTPEHNIEYAEAIERIKTELIE